MPEYDLMSDFTSPFWAWYIFIIVAGSIIWLFYLLMTQNKDKNSSTEIKPT